MSFVFPLIAFAGVLLATFRSLGWGFLAVLAVGYFNGVVRANFLGVYTTFMFDAAVLGLYLGFFFGRSRRAAGVRLGPAGPFVLFLIAWPALLSFVPVNHFLVQLVALRATVWFLPVLLIATRLTAADLAVMTRGLAVLNLVALAGGIYVYLYGVEALYPKNPITRIIYTSKDVAGYKYHRIPSIVPERPCLRRDHAVHPAVPPRPGGWGGGPANGPGVGRGRGGCGRRRDFAVRRPVPAGLARGDARGHLGPDPVLLEARAGRWPSSSWGLVRVASTNERFQRAGTLEDTEICGRPARRERERIVPGLADGLPAGGRDGVLVRDQHPITSWPTWPRNRSGWRMSTAGSWSTRVGSGWAGGWRSSDGCAFARPRPGRRPRGGSGSCSCTPSPWPPG